MAFPQLVFLRKQQIISTFVNILWDRIKWKLTRLNYKTDETHMSKDHWKKCINLSQGLFFQFYAFPPLDFQSGAVVKKMPAKAGDAGDQSSIPGSGRPPGGGNGNPLLYSYLENPMDRGDSVQFSCSVMSDSLRPHGLQHPRLPCPSPTPGDCSNSCISSQWCHPTISSSVVPFSSYLQFFQHQGLFQWVSSSHQVAKVLEL